ncbi:MAG: hypothetical protein Q7R82_02755 [Candidatus Daviesbacteria bacterium]|nr:hypothetical protein [Candidatus Daviesbacteria bacterium]
MIIIKQIEKYFSSHVRYNSLVHVIAGIGIGILITYPLAGVHPVRWGIALVAIGILGHLYPLLKK